MRIFAIAAALTLGLAGLLHSKPAEAAGMSCLPASLKSTIAQIQQKFGPVQVISTYRKGARIKGTGRRSKHADCRAIDFNPPRGKYKAVVSWLKQNHSGGIGTYSCGMHHIHIDNGGRYHWHTCAK